MLVNKFQASVGGIIQPEGSKGLVFIFPDIKNKKDFIAEFIEHVLPQVAPLLFPDFNKSKWDNDAAYELTQVTNLKHQIDTLQEETDKKIASLKESISENKSRNEFLFDLARETGDKLVEAVIMALNIMGFKQVIDVDKQQSGEDKNQLKREDVQIQDYDQTLVCEIKGINNHPKEDDCIVVIKYVQSRMKEWNRTNVQGLTIINHQRNLPPHDREHEKPFTQISLDSAEALMTGFGLMTGWDLHRLTRSFIQNKWKHENVKDLFYKLGRIEPIPSHYEYIGKIAGFIENKGVVGITIKNSQLRKGDRIAFELPVVFEEQDCPSLQAENKEVEGVAEGIVGIKTTLTKQQAKVGIRVFRIVTD